MIFFFFFDSWFWWHSFKVLARSFTTLLQPFHFLSVLKLHFCQSWKVNDFPGLFWACILPFSYVVFQMPLYIREFFRALNPQNTWLNLFLQGFQLVFCLSQSLPFAPGGRGSIHFLQLFWRISSLKLFSHQWSIPSWAKQRQALPVNLSGRPQVDQNRQTQFTLA